MGVATATADEQTTMVDTQQLPTLSSSQGFLSGQRIDLSHQEMDRLLHALEELYNDSKASTPEMEWMPMAGVGNLLAHELGYEDQGEFEDAMGCAFEEFLRNFPHIELKEDTRFTGGLVFRVRGEPPREEWRPTQMAFTVRTRQDLWRVCHKSPHARIVIHPLEFEISPDGNRRIDTLYNHLAQAAFNLTSHAGPSGAGSQMESDVKQRILSTVASLNKLLDVEEPFEISVIDPSGLSEIKPAQGVVISPLDLQASN